MPEIPQKNTINESIKEALADEGTIDPSLYNVKVFVQNKKPKMADEFAMFFQQYNGILMSLKPPTLKLFVFLMNDVAYNNFIEIMQKEIAIILKMHPQTIKKSMKELIDMSLIKSYRTENDRRTNFYMINPHVLWKGRPENRNKMIKKYPEFLPIESNKKIQKGIPQNIQKNTEKLWNS